MAEGFILAVRPSSDHRVDCPSLLMESGSLRTWVDMDLSDQSAEVEGGVRCGVRSFKLLWSLCGDQQDTRRECAVLFPHLPW